MNPKKRPGVSKREFQSSVYGDHISSHSCGIGTCLDLELVEFYALDRDFGFHRLTGTPENQREQGEEDEETENEGEDVAAAREAFLALFGFEEAFFFDDGALLPGLLALPGPTAGGVVGRDLARSRL